MKVFFIQLLLKLLYVVPILFIGIGIFFTLKGKSIFEKMSAVIVFWNSAVLSFWVITGIAYFTKAFSVNMLFLEIMKIISIISIFTYIGYLFYSRSYK